MWTCSCCPGQRSLRAGEGCHPAVPCYRCLGLSFTSPLCNPPDLCIPGLPLFWETHPNKHRISGIFFRIANAIFFRNANAFAFAFCLSILPFRSPKAFESRSFLTLSLEICWKFSELPSSSRYGDASLDSFVFIYNARCTGDPFKLKTY